MTSLLRLQREPSDMGATIGGLYLNDRWIMWTLEDGIREPVRPAGGIVTAEWVTSWKINRKTCIPQGRYQVGLTLSARFGVVLPEIMNVPGFSGIRIHSGNTVDDTDGCILVGSSRGDRKIYDSRHALEWLMMQLQPMEAIVIDVQNPPGLHLEVNRRVV